MNPFELSLPDSLAEASRLGGPEAVYKAAGIDLLDRLKERVENPKTVVNLLALRAELSGIARGGTDFDIGALTTLQQVADSSELDEPGFAALRESAGHAATPQVRARATVGGNLLQKTRCWYLRSAAFGCAHGGDGPTCLAREGENRYHSVLGTIDCVRTHPSNLAPALIVLGAEVTAVAGEDSRRIAVARLYPDAPMAANPENTLTQGEIVTHVHVPAAAGRGRSAYRESREMASFDWATTSAAVHLVLDGDEISQARICLGAVAPNPWVAEEAALALRGEKPSAKLFEEVARLAYQDALALTQNGYKIEVGQGVLRDALAAAAGTR